MIFGLFLHGCGQAEEDQTSGYLLRSEQQGEGIQFLRYMPDPDHPEDTITGYMYIALPAANPSGVYLETWRITGSMDDSRILVQLDQNPEAAYTGTVEGDTIELVRGLSTWEGEAATLEDFGEAAEELARESQEETVAD